MIRALSMLLLFPVLPAAAQDAGRVPKVEIPWDRFNDCAGLERHMLNIQKAFPDLCSMQSIGKSYEGRQMWVMTVHNSKAGKESDKPAMWVDGNVHGNEVQGGEACLYLAWYLTENFESNPTIRALLDRYVFYILPTQNPDGRDDWFHAPNTPSSSRSGKKPTDNDGDGLFDEDGPDDIDGDGEILRMRKFTPGTGDYRVDSDDPRRMIRVPAGKKGDWTLLGLEGIDNDGDGELNEDGPGGYDLNRNWPSDWQPNYIQFGAGDYPFSHAEPRNIGNFFLSHPNIASVQSFHNAGGMILRGPGASYVPEYPGRDLAVYDDLGLQGEKMLPFYKYMVIHKDLYTVHGGFVNWGYEGLGIFSITNEMWTGDQLFQSQQARRGPAFGGAGGAGGFNVADVENGPTRGRPASLEDPTLQDDYIFDELLMAGATFVPWHKVQHPQYGEVELGGFRKMTGRVPPSFMIEEMLHRNALFCVYQAQQMPDVALQDVTVEKAGADLSVVTAVLVNRERMPTRSTLAAQKKMGEPDLLTISGDGLTVAAGGIATDRFSKNLVNLADREPARLLLEDGVPGFGRVTVRWYVRGKGTATIRYEAEKAAGVSTTVRVD